jgi:hypothetical protein
MRRTLSLLLAGLVFGLVVAPAPADANPFGLGWLNPPGTDPERTLSLGEVAAGWLDAGLREVGRSLRKRMVFRLRRRGESHVIPFDVAGVTRAREVLAAVHPGRGADGAPAYESEGAWLLLQALGDEEFRLRFERTATFLHGDAPVFFLTIYLDEPPYPVDGGTALNVAGRRGPARTRLGAGEAFWQMLERTGNDLATVAGMNPGAVHVGAAAWRLGDQPRDIRVGEPRLLRSGGIEDFLAVLLHEAAHVGDGARCAAGLGYGADGAHRISEVISPYGAFKEGWADYVGASLPGAFRRALAARPDLVFEWDEGRYEKLPRGQRSLRHFLSTEIYVADLLQRVEALPPGEAGVLRAFMDTHEVPCRDVGDLLVAYLRRYPEQRVGVIAALDETSEGVATPRELTDAALRGDLGRGAEVLPPVSGHEGPPQVAADGAVLVEDYGIVE